MLFQFNFYSSLLLVFFIHGLVYAGLFWRRARWMDSPADGWLAAFLFLCILYITPWMVGFAGWYDNQPYRDILFYTPLQHLFFIGPVIFFYVRSFLNPGFRFERKHGIHFLPGLLYILYCLVVFITDQLVLKKYYFLASESDPDFSFWYQLLGFVSMAFYFTASIRYYRKYRQLVFQVRSDADAHAFSFVPRFLWAFLLMLLTRVLFYLLDLFFDQGYADFWWYFLAFALIYYYIAITGYSNIRQSPLVFRLGDIRKNEILYLNYKPQGLLPNAEAGEWEVLEEIKDSPEPELAIWKERISNVLGVEKLYEDPELTLTKLARLLDTNSSRLSRMINKGFGQNFNDLVNQYRVEAVLRLIEAGELKRQTLLSLAFEAGFNSKATFNRAFLKLTGQSPRDYLKR